MGILECYPCAIHLAFAISFNPNHINFTNRETELREVKNFSDDYISSMWHCQDLNPGCLIPYHVLFLIVLLSYTQLGKLSHLPPMIARDRQQQRRPHESGSVVHHRHSNSPVPPSTFLHRAEKIE